MSLNKMVVRAVQNIKEILEPEFYEAVMELLDKLGPLNSFTFNVGVTSLRGRSNNVSFGVLAHDEIRELIVEELTERKKNRFTTHADSVTYCNGTKYLLEILTKYTHIKHEKYEIVAVPGVESYECTGSGIKLITDDPDYKLSNKRKISVMLVHGNNIFVFNLAEFVK